MFDYQYKILLCLQNNPECTPEYIRNQLNIPLTNQEFLDLGDMGLLSYSADNHIQYSVYSDSKLTLTSKGKAVLNDYISQENEKNLASKLAYKTYIIAAISLVISLLFGLLSCFNEFFNK